MNRNPDGSRLIRNRAGDGLPNPPGGVSTELVPFFPIKLVNCLDQTEVSLLDQIQEQHPAAYIFFGNADNQTQVRFTKLLLGLFISGLHFLRQFDFFLRGKERHLSDLFQIHANRIIHRDPLGNRRFQIDFLGIAAFRDCRLHIRIIDILVLQLTQLQRVRLDFRNNFNSLRHQLIIEIVHIVFIQLHISHII